MSRIICLYLHQCCAHPLLFWTSNATWAVRFHDATARFAFPEE
jgi:hypothetical protein